MSIFAIILLRQVRDPKLWDGILQDRVIWVSTDLEKTRQHFETIDGHNSHFNATYYKPIAKVLVETQQNHEFDDHFVNEKTISNVDVADIPLKDLLSIHETDLLSLQNKMERVTNGMKYWEDGDRDGDVHNVGKLSKKEQINFFKDCIYDKQKTMKELRARYK